jgi:O-antigen/teichoic acid export membrane protein
VEQFGLLVLLLQVGAYFTLVEIGISSAAARILIDYKDSPDSGAYGSVILTGFGVLALQGAIIISFGIFASPWIVNFIGVPAALAEEAALLLRWLAITSAVSLTFRMYGSVLYAHKHLDLIHAFTGGNMLFSVSLLWFILASGGGLSGLIWLFIAQTTLAILLPALACKWLRLLPTRGCWGKPTLQRLRELIGFGKDIFLINVGTQVLEASQLIIVTRTMGLTAAAIWSVSTKLFVLVYQLVTKIEGTAIVFFAEMMVRDEKTRLALRFRQVYQLTAGVAIVSLSVMVAVNRAFVTAWADASLAWPIVLSAMFAGLVFLNALTKCCGDLIVFTKQLGLYRYVYLIEAGMFLFSAVWLGSSLGFYGIIGPSLLCLLLFRATYTTLRMADYFQLPAITFWWTWLKGPILAATVLAPIVLTGAWFGASFGGKWNQFLATGICVGLPAIIVLFLIVIPRELKQELAGRWRQCLPYARGR